VTCTLPNQMVKGMEVMLTPSPAPDASLPSLIGPNPVVQMISTSPGLAALHVVLTPPQVAALVKTGL